MTLTRLKHRERMRQIVLGALCVEVPQRRAEAQAAVIAEHVFDLIEREAEWVNRGVEPWRRKGRKGAA